MVEDFLTGPSRLEIEIFKVLVGGLCSTLTSVRQPKRPWNLSTASSEWPSQFFLHLFSRHPKHIWAENKISCVLNTNWKGCVESSPDLGFSDTLATHSSPSFTFARAIRLIRIGRWIVFPSFPLPGKQLHNERCYRMLKVSFSAPRKNSVKSLYLKTLLKISFSLCLSTLAHLVYEFKAQQMGDSVLKSL